jgi:prefoldin subunit 4
MRVGESFVHMSAEEANAVMDDMKTKLENDIAELRVEEAKHAESLTKLKAELYAKFGDAINLDNSDAS